MKASQIERDPVEALAEEFLSRRRRGEEVSVDGYAQAHPEWADPIRELFPTLLWLEERKPDEHGSSAPCDAEDAPGEAGGRRVGDFRIIREVGRGGMGVVFEAEQESLGRHVALKVLAEVSVASSTRLARFRREARAAARLHHTNIVPVFGVGRQDDMHYIVMQFIRGNSLDRIVRHLAARHSDRFARGNGKVTRNVARGGARRALSDDATTPELASKLSGMGTGKVAADPTGTPPHRAGRPAALPLDRHYWHSAARIGVQVADALAYAHQRGTLHRDVKPANLLMDTGGTVWVSDFGLAKCAEREDLTESGEVVGTLRYMAPEVFRGRVDARSDVYSLGLTLYELLTLQPAFDETAHHRLLIQVTEERPLPPRKHNPGIPRDLETIVLKAIARDPGRRYQTARELEEDLQRFLEDRPIRARRATPIGRLARWCRRNPALASLSGMAIGLLAAVAVVASIGYVQTTGALARESEQRRAAEAAGRRTEIERMRTQAEYGRAEANLQLAVEAFEDVFTRIASDDAILFPEPDLSEEEQEVEVVPVVTQRDAALLQGMLRFYDQFAEQNRASASLQRETVQAYRRVGDIQRRLGRFEESLVAYRRAAAICDDLEAGGAASEGIGPEPAALQNEIGLVLRMAGRHPEARAAHGRALRILEAQPPASMASRQYRYELARSHNFLAYLRFMFEDGNPGKGGAKSPRHRGPAPRFAPDKGPDHARSALTLLEGLIEEDPHNPDYRVAMAHSLRNLAAVAWIDDAPQDGFAAADRAVGILDSLVRDFPAVADYRYELAQTYAMADGRATDPGVLDERQQRLERAVEIGEQLAARHPTVPEYRVALAGFQQKLFRVLEIREEFAAAEGHFSRAIELLRSVVERYPAVQMHQMRLARYRRTLAEFYQQQGRPEAARAVLERSIAGLEESWDAGREDPFVRDVLAKHYRTLADALKALGEPQRAEEVLQQADALDKRGGRLHRGPPRRGPGAAPGGFRPPMG